MTTQRSSRERDTATHSRAGTFGTSDWYVTRRVSRPSRNGEVSHIPSIALCDRYKKISATAKNTTAHRSKQVAILAVGRSAHGRICPSAPARQRCGVARCGVASAEWRGAEWRGAEPDGSPLLVSPALVSRAWYNMLSPTGVRYGGQCHVWVVGNRASRSMRRQMRSGPGGWGCGWGAIFRETRRYPYRGLAIPT